jgi:hypothetical protein
MRPIGLSVRMYQVGFGDCFLLTFHYAKSDDHHILIDFGSTKLPRTTSPDVGLLKVAEAIRDVCKNEEHPKGKLTAVVATHRHKDHISGFATNKTRTASGNVIADMIPELVIQPWTEDPKAATDAVKATSATSNGLAKTAFVRSLREMNAFAKAVVEEVKRRKAENAALNLRASTMLTKLEFLGETNLPNPSAVKNLMDMGKRKNAEYLAYGDPTALEDLLPGVKVHVLGPPTLEQSKAILEQRARDPEEFWHLVSRSALQSFKTSDGATKPLFSNRIDPENERSPLMRSLTAQLDRMSREQTLELVRIMDEAINNTSLILLFEIAGRAFLFPGDAQIENWLYALKHARHREKTLALLRRVELYKVGHHGSLNATPKSLWKLFELKSGNAANKKRLKTIVSTLHGKHGQIDRGTEVPREKLVKELKAKSDFFSTDSKEMTAAMAEEGSELCKKFSFKF